MQQAERAVFDIRRGQPVHISGPEAGVLVAAVEGLTPALINRLRVLGCEKTRLAVTSHRARWTGIANHASAAMSLLLPDGIPVSEIVDLCTARHDTTPAEIADRARPVTPLESAALAVVRASRLLPAALVTGTGPVHREELAALIKDGTILDVPADQALALASSPRLQVSETSDAIVPLADSEESRFVLFREANGVQEHVAVLIGDPKTWPNPVPVRLHSACLTGDLFGSLRCDCGEQLRGSVREIANTGGGVLLYLAQEGRGIGLANKLRAYRLQDQGMDTVDADCSLGFGADERRYEAAVEMLQTLGIDRVRLLTNNPDKVRALQEAGIDVADRQPLLGKLNRHNARYLTTKADRAGHFLEELLRKA
ncbi:GTP cyclohydrolase II [Natronocella acetinitrilica]|uniref:GTP cyclohydrolase-2 n=1 Tax=Natronocella acetinitrilica TaxID=414046 RepID=A0AAE3G0W4_9GAMM|nr:GTP cyclohydrolase II [Natronocella acetinitrilica]MCP1673470.1 GTP cyclohydrolase II [Natronocella acetinitrilica]